MLIFYYPSFPINNFATESDGIMLFINRRDLNLLHRCTACLFPVTDQKTQLVNIIVNIRLFSHGYVHKCLILNEYVAHLETGSIFLIFMPISFLLETVAACA